MQLAGKPSLIDPTRAIARSKERKGPLTFDRIAVKPIAGASGRKLEDLYAAYFEVQRALALDQKPPASAAQTLHTAAAELQKDPALPERAASLLQVVAAKSEHLHHLDLAGARKEFKPVSHAVVTLATMVRSESSTKAFTHFYCPMVPGGGGDWLQPGGELINPYFGSEMLNCGERVQEFPPRREPSIEATPAKKSPAAQGTQSET
jgi:Cu(I)/Ag(I) efflux system membrane fusion protein